MSSANEVDDEDSDDDSSDENEDEGDATPPGTDEEASAAVQHLAVDTTSSAYVGFQKWIQNACGGTPTLGYPAAIVLISTLPAEVRE